MGHRDDVNIDRRKLLKAAGGGALSLTVAGCAGNTGGDGNGSGMKQNTGGDGNSSGMKQNSIKAALAGATELNSLDPVNADQSATWAVIYSMMEGLVDFDDKMNLQPELATDWKYLSDTELKFNLRKGVKFHNGDSFTGKDVKFTLERIANGNFTNSSLWQPLDHVEVKDPHTIIIHTAEPFSPLLTYLAGNSPTGGQILPKGTVTDNFSRKPIGTGPFQFESWKAQSNITVVKFDDYWGEKSNLSRVEMPMFSQGSSAVASVKAGDVGMMNRLPLQSVDTIKKASDVSLGQAPGLTLRMVLYNHEQEPLSDRNVRMAFAKAVNKETALQTAWFGQGEVSKGPIPPAHSLDPSDLTNYQKFNPKEAKSLIAKSDYSVSEINDMNVKILTWGSGLWYQFSKIIANQIKQNLGINIKVNSLTFSKVLTKLDSQSFDMASWGYRGFTAADQYMYAYVSGSSPNQYRSYKNKKYDKLVFQARAETKPKKRRKTYRKATQILAKDAADMFLVHANMLEAFRNYIQNYQTSPQGDYAHDFNYIKTKNQ